jgi:murein DD-endopeptidase MepM/ murein hydrolase activator NlpD
LEVLAQRYHTTPGAIAAANRLRPQDVPAPGESLYVLGPGRDRPEAELPWFRSTPVAEIDRTPTPSKESRQGGDGAARAKQSAPPRSFDGEPRFEWPVERGLGRITSSFGARGERPHRGIDIVVPEGFIVRAADDGEVIYSDNRLAGYGNTVMIRHSAQGAGLVTVYAHNRENLVKVGQRVQRGQSIARVGATGNAQVAHLHFEVREGAEAKDPQPYLERPRRAALTP